ncbi:hypothetical protein D3C72_2127980 [compost metagenome]
MLTNTRLTVQARFVCWVAVLAQDTNNNIAFTGFSEVLVHFPGACLTDFDNVEGVQLGYVVWHDGGGRPYFVT